MKRFGVGTSGSGVIGDLLLYIKPFSGTAYPGLDDKSRKLGQAIGHLLTSYLPSVTYDAVVAYLDAYRNCDRRAEAAAESAFEEVFKEVESDAD